MSTDPNALSPIKRAFLALEAAEAKLAAHEAAAREPIAVVGLGCRVPGADGPAAFWQLLAEGRDAVGPIPRERFDIERFFDADPSQPGGIAVREAGFLNVPVGDFDAGFFGISPREARGMDPQQRLLLEVAWEALEHAGLAPDRLSGSSTGVFVGQASADWATLVYKAGDPALLDAHFTSGIAHSVSSGRISYLLGLQGPSLTVDTACSSSLVAVHLACQSLRAGECRMALAGGVNLMLSEDLFIAFSHSRMLAPDGRCKTFDAAADGFGRGEGCGVVVLKRLADARADGDRILALIRGSAVNQDGPSSGLTAPNGPQQEAVIRSALQRGGLAPADIGYVEAHGTGTQLGDPLEVQALANVFGPGRDAAQPLAIGSVKTNLGHLEAAAGITGLIKLVLALQQRTIPAHLHFHQPSPHIDWQGWPVAVPTTARPWVPLNGRRIGGVSSFGYSGTNAHVVVEEAPAAPAAPVDAAVPMLYTLSARSAAALRMLARRHRDALDAAPDAPLAAICRTANAGRAAFAHRAALLVSSRAELRERLDALAEGRELPGLRSAPLQRREPPRIAFLFTGQGAQYAGMARGLYDGLPAFRHALDRCAAALARWLEVTLHELLFGDDAVRLDHTAGTQPALFALEVALAETWRALGIEPTVLLGHSVGEIGAACVAGVFPLEAAARLVGERARRMGALPPGGAMAAVAAPEEALAPHLARHPGVSVAAWNSPAQTVVSGPAEAVSALCAELEAHGLRCQALKVSHAFHSSLMEPMLEGFEQALQGLPAGAPRLRLVSNLDGTLATGTALAQPGYWRRQVREPVRFADGVRTLLAQQPDLCLEIGPHPALLGFVAPVAPGLPLLASLRKGRADRATFLEALASLWLEGAPVDWRALHAGEAAAPIAWPTYPFERERCWFTARPLAPPARAGTHPLLGTRLRSAAEQRLHDGQVAAGMPAWVAQHRVHGRVVLPATAWLDLLLAAAADRHGRADAGLEDVTVQQALLLDDDTCLLQTVVEPVRDGAAAARVASQAADAAADAPWTTHVTARLPVAAGDALAGAASLASLEAARAACTDPVEVEAFYAGLAASGLDFGPAFRSLVQIHRGPGQACGEVRLHPDLEAERGRWHIHPVLLDGCVQLLAAAVEAEPGALFLPLAIGRYRLLRRPAGAVWAHVVAAPGGGTQTRRADVQVFEADGTPVAQLLDLQLKRVELATLAPPAGVEALLHELVWRERPRRPALPTPAALAAQAAAALAGPQADATLADYDAALPRLDRLCAAYIAQALIALGQPGASGATVDTAALPVVPRHRRLLARLLAILGEQGWLAREAGQWRVARDLSSARTADDDAALSACADETALSRRTGAALADALRGAADPLELLFPGGDTSTAERVYREAAPARLFNGTVGALVAAAAVRPLRILEIGAGTGGTTAHVLPLLPPGAAHYSFTDVGPAFVARARERFAGAAVAMSFQVFDLERDGAGQGLAEGGHDLVIASNVVHATRDLRASLRRIRRLLAPGGLLLMLEACAPQPWFDVTVGLTEGWWAFEDHDLRPDYPTLPRVAWLRLLREEGFVAEAAGGDPATPGVRGLNVLLVAQRAPAPRRWLVHGAPDGAAGELTRLLQARGESCQLVAGGTPLPDTPVDGVIHAGALDGNDAQAIALDALRVAQQLAARATPARLWLLTRGAQAATRADAVEAPQAAVLWGLARTLRLEHPALGTTCIDLDGTTPLDALPDELDDESDEPDRALRGSTRRVARLLPLARPEPPPPAPPAWQLRPAQPGSLEAFRQVPVARRAPGPGEVEIAVEATGLNFKDVLNALGLYPGEAGPLGGECAGRVVALGAGVTGLAPGDAVLALAGGSFASHVVAPAGFVRRLPAGIGMAEGASFAIAHLTAEFCLMHLAGLRAGQTVLVHAAAGGVGLAALRIAQRAGATVYATAGADWKRALLRELGAAQVFDSRSAAFLDGIRAATGGRGVDVVLNSLAGELIEPSFAALADGGCFVEIGKRGIKTPEEVTRLGRGLRYHVVDWGATAAREPALIAGLLDRLLAQLADGTLAPLPRHDFTLAEAPQAFRFMAQARHAGRIVLCHAPPDTWRPSPRGSYLVSGGLSGVGLAVARWLGEQGAGRLVLIGRRGVTAEAEPVIAALRERGVTVLAEALDVADEAGLRRLLQRVRADGPPLRGVFHAAGALDEAVLLQQDARHVATVFGPKLHGAQWLDRLTRADALDAFVLFSSIAGVLGAAGQANHAAASAGLDALAHERRARGLPALAIDWGAWSEIGAAAGRDLGARLAAQGLATFPPADGLAALERLMAGRSTQALVVAIDWDTWRRRLPAPSALLDELAQRRPAAAASAPAAPAAGGDDLLAQLERAPPARRRALLAGFVRERALAALGLDAGHALDPRLPLGELGLDSLLAVELRNALATALKRPLPATLLFDHPTVDALADHLHRDFFTAPPPQSDVRTPPGAPPAAARIIDAVAELSDDEVERRLAALKRPGT